MKNGLVILFLFITSSTAAQINEHFYDQNFSTKPQWDGDTSAFHINYFKQLQTSRASLSQDVILYTANTLATQVKWEFSIQLDFNPSPSNQVRIYLISDNKDLKSALNGYFIQIGENGDTDSYHLYRQEGVTSHRIIKNVPKVRQHPNLLSIRIQVSRNKNGVWELRSDNTGGTDYVLDGRVHDDKFITTAWFGVQCKYKSFIRSNGFMFDYFIIEPLPLEATSIPSSKPRDITINEIFVNPNPSIKLPNAEFIELKNNTNLSLSLKNWSYSNAKTKFVFNQDSICGQEYLILCSKADTALFQSYGRVIGLSPWPRLNNMEDHLYLKNEIGTIISEVIYKNTWHKNFDKSISTGRTLEQINPNSNCNSIQNWAISRDPSGGTPGQQNSVYTTAYPPLKLIQTNLSDHKTLLLTFNQSLDTISTSLATNYTLNNGLGHPLLATPIPPYFKSISLKFKNSIARGIPYTISIQNLTDCYNNQQIKDSRFLEFTLPNEIKPGDILISEILFNPQKNNVDFVEIYNNSTNPLDLKELFISNFHNKTDKLHPISTETHLIQPKQYIVLTTNPDKIKQHYSTENSSIFLKMNTIPSFYNNTGTVALISNSTLIDQLNYSESIHFKLIREQKGISLERSSFHSPTNEPGNFKSASASSGFATPGYKNSQSTNFNQSEEFALLSKTFSPNSDGFEDFLDINYKFSNPPGVATVDIYNDRGLIVKKLIKNQTLATEGTIRWDGLNEQDQLAEIGIYTIYTEIFDLHGNIKRYRLTCALATKLD